jgi:hypothetical protein
MEYMDEIPCTCDDSTSNMNEDTFKARSDFPDFMITWHHDQFQKDKIPYMCHFRGEKFPFQR